MLNKDDYTVCNSGIVVRKRKCVLALTYGTLWLQKVQPEFSSKASNPFLKWKSCHMVFLTVTKYIL